MLQYQSNVASQLQGRINAFRSMLEVSDPDTAPFLTPMVVKGSGDGDLDKGIGTPTKKISGSADTHAGENVQDA